MNPLIPNLDDAVERLKKEVKNHPLFATPSIDPLSLYNPQLMTENNVSNPLNRQEGGSHYRDCKIQPIEFIQGNKIPFIEGNIIKYAVRHPFKNRDEDIKKIIHYAKLLLKLEYNYTDQEISKL